MIFCSSGHLQNEQEARHETKIYEHDKARWKDPELTTLFSEVGGCGTNVQSKQAHVLQYNESYR